MTEPTEAAEAETLVIPEREITFRGRTIWVRMPRPEQILVWKRTLAQIQGADSGSWTGEGVMVALERATKIIYSLILHQTDKDWLDDQMLEGTLTLIEVSQIIQLTTEAYAADDNRADRRAAKKATPAKKATRKKAR